MKPRMSELAAMRTKLIDNCDLSGIEKEQRLSSLLLSAYTLPGYLAKPNYWIGALVVVGTTGLISQRVTPD
ncbi:MAG: hypothetical protein JWO13_2224 [Acidobacteriales bacterium]|nr:hypothetical protein [Terriglobales bacterium]